MNHRKGSCITKLDHLSVTARGVKILDNINMVLPCGCFAAVVGPNGAGKSSLIKSLIGEIKYSGVVTFNDQKRKPRLGYVPQKINFDRDNPCTVRDLFYLSLNNLPFFLNFGKKLDEKIFRSLADVEADALINRPLSALSGGEIRRVFLALALINEPQVLLLDEPGAGLDQNGLELFYSLMAHIRMELDLSILMVSHDFTLVKQYADYTYLLSGGHLVDEGNPGQVFSRQPFKTLFGF